MTIPTEIREIFEVWVSKQPSAALIGPLEREGDTYKHLYYSNLWECWKECYKSLVVQKCEGAPGFSCYLPL